MQLSLLLLCGTKNWQRERMKRAGSTDEGPESKVPRLEEGDLPEDDPHYVDDDQLDEDLVGDERDRA